MNITIANNRLTIKTKTLRVTITIFTILLFSIATNKMNAQTFEWAKSFGAIYNEEGSSITTDAAGNIYTTGTFREP
jgi:hypothetical protein